MIHVFLFLHNSGKGVSEARNIGIDHVLGKYVVFVDADDWLPENSLELRYSLTRDKDFGCGYCRHRILDETGRITREVSIQCARDYENGVEYIARAALFESGYFNGLEYVWDKIFCTDVIVNNHLRFDNHMSRYEDRKFVLEYMCVCDK